MRHDRWIIFLGIPVIIFFFFRLFVFFWYCNFLLRSFFILLSQFYYRDFSGHFQIHLWISREVPRSFFLFFPLLIFYISLYVCMWTATRVLLSASSSSSGPIVTHLWTLLDMIHVYYLELFGLLFIIYFFIFSLQWSLFFIRFNWIINKLIIWILDWGGNLKRVRNESCYNIYIIFLKRDIENETF